MPTRDRPELLARAVTSVLTQTTTDFELLIVDNNRECQRVPVQRWAHDPRVKVLPAPMARSAAAARNVGLAAARGGWVSYLDDDDVYRPDKLTRQLDRATQTDFPLVLCGAAFHLRGRQRRVQTDADWLREDALLNSARWNTPLLLHMNSPGLRFDEDLTAGEDGVFAHALLTQFSLRALPVVAQVLVDVFQDQAVLPRTNLHAGGGWMAARRIWWRHGHRHSPAARRLFVVRALMTRAKLQGQTGRCLTLVPKLLRQGGRGQLRFALNALVLSTGLGRGRFVT